MNIELSRTSLYFPEIEVPLQWAKQALLYTDEIASICPGSLDEVLEGDVTSHMRELSSTPFYRTIHPDNALKFYGDRIFDEFATALLLPKVSNSIKTQQPEFNRAFVPVHHMKMDNTLRELLLDSEYATPINSDHIAHYKFLQTIGQHTDWLLIRDDVARIYMDILAKRIAYLDSNTVYESPLRYTIASTDHKLHRDLAFGVRSRMPLENDYNASTSFALSLHMLLPAPAPETEIGQILEFRSKYKDDVPRLRLLMASFERKLSEVESKKDVVNVLASFSDTVSEGMRELHSNLRKSGVDFTIGSVTALLSLNVSNILENIAKGHGLGNIIEKYPVEYQGVALAVAGMIGFGVVVTNRWQQNQHALESSPFSYLYRIEQELQ